MTGSFVKALTTAEMGFSPSIVTINIVWELYKNI